MGLNSQLFVCTAALFICVFLWIKKPFGLPFSVTALIFLSVSIVMGVPAQVAFSGFASGSFWTLVPALFFGYALVSTGLGNRIAYFLLVRVKTPTLPKLLGVFCAIGIILSLLTPSMAVRVVIVAPIAVSCAELCGFGKATKERSILVLTAWIAAVVPGTAWLTGSLSGPLLNGMFLSTGLGEISFADWARVSFLPIFLTVALTVVLGYLAARPSEKPRLAHTVFEEAYAKIGAAKRTELVTGIVLVCCFILFATRNLHGLPDAVVCIAGFAALCGFGVLRTNDFGTGISWDLALFMGATMGFGAVFEQTGLSAGLTALVSPLIAPVASQSPGVFLILALVLLFAWRFVDIATFVPTFAIITAMLPGFARDFGISPLVWLPLLCLAQNTFLMSYTNLFALIMEQNTGEWGWERKTFSKYGMIYCGAALLAVAVSLPQWSGMGLLGQ